uniref:4HBT domain-containing protein n=1 Tax=Rhabditophanes sp. KR3021 TaxID=114890 RepID=A0AC35UAL5_9BILA
MSGKYFNRIKQFMTLASNKETHMKSLTQARLIHADEGNVKIELEVLKEHTNPFGTLHGGYSSTLIDNVTTMALISTIKGSPGVSVDLHVSFLSSAKIGETIVVEATVVKSGKNLAFSEGKIYNKATNALVASGLHTQAFPYNPLAVKEK